MPRPVPRSPPHRQPPSPVSWMTLGEVSLACGFWQALPGRREAGRSGTWLGPPLRTYQSFQIRLAAGPGTQTLPPSVSPSVMGTDHVAFLPQEERRQNRSIQAYASAPRQHKMLPWVLFPRLIEAATDKPVRRAAVWDLPGCPGVFGALRVTGDGCHQKQQMFKSLYLMKTGSAHFLAVFPQ